MKKIFSGIVLLGLIGCIQHTDNNNPQPELLESEVVSMEVKYAEGFDIKYEKDYIKIVTHSLEKNKPFRDSVCILTSSEVPFENDVKLLSNSIERIACQSSTHLAFMRQLEAEDMLSGLCGVQYINDEYLRKKMKENGVAELCMGDAVQTEALFKANPDLFLIYPFGDTGEKSWESKGIKTLFIGEYLERTQLARLEWIKLFGLITGRAQEANSYFKAVEEKYLELKSATDGREETFIMNLPFKDTWSMPSSKSVGVSLIEDAGINYYYRNESGTENQLRSVEEVWEDGIESDYWVIVADRPPHFSLEDLKAEEAVYSEFKAVKEHQVIFCNINEVDFFARGIIEPDIVLKDLLFATGQIEGHSPKYFFLLD